MNLVELLAVTMAEQVRSAKARAVRDAKELGLIEATALFLMEAASLGLSFRVPGRWGMSSPTFEVAEKMDFVTLHRLVGTLEDAGRCTWQDDTGKAATNKVWAMLRPTAERWSHITFKYVAPIKKVASKCLVVTVKQKAYKTVVCER